LIEAAGSLSAPAVEFLTNPTEPACVWVYVELPIGATSADLEPLVNRYGLDSRAILDCCERRILPRAGGEGRLATAVLVLPSLARTPDERSPTFGLFVGSDFVLTIHDGSARQIADLFRECQADPATRGTAFQYGSRGLAAAVVERVVAQAVRATVAIAHRASDFAPSVARAESGADAREVAALRTEATRLAAVLSAERLVVVDLAARVRGADESGDRFSAPWGALVGRLDEAASIAQGAARSLDSTIAVRGLMAAEGTLGATRFGAAVGTLTLPALLALALVAASGEAARPQVFEVVLAAVAAYVVGGLYIFRRNDWL
jgi:magnesium transporter